MLLEFTAKDICKPGPQSLFASKNSYIERLINYDKLTTGYHFHKDGVMTDGSMLLQCHC